METSLHEGQQLDNESQTHLRGGSAGLSIGRAENVNVGNNCKVVVNISKAKTKPSGIKKGKLNQYPLTTSNQPVTVDQKLAIKHKVGRGWKDLGRMLGLEGSELEQLEMENLNNYSEVVYQILTRWEQRVAHGATQEALAIVFQKLGRGDLSDLLSHSFTYWTSGDISILLNHMLVWFPNVLARYKCGTERFSIETDSFFFLFYFCL